MRNVFSFFLVFFLLSFIFSLAVSIVFFKLIFRFSPQSHSPSRSAPDKRERPFCFAADHSFDFSAFLAYEKKYGLLCGLKDFALIDALVSRKL